MDVNFVLIKSQQPPVWGSEVGVAAEGFETFTWSHRDLLERQNRKNFYYDLIMVRMCSNVPKMNRYDS